MYAVVGLGNPGSKYANTRHNVGFAVADLLAMSQGADRFREKFQAQVAELNEDGDKILLVKPLTFMNLSGQCVRKVVDFYHLEPKQVLVVCDDVNLTVGQLRFRPKGSHGGHNGLRDIQNHLGTNEYPRLRIGVGAPDEKDLVNHVLGKFRPSEKADIEEAIRKAAEAVSVWWKSGIEKCMNEYN
jgi:PTH1 family peptidyl-tRNA hydrolase